MSPAEQSPVSYVTRGGVVVTRSMRSLEGLSPIDAIVDELDLYRGVLLSSSYEYPGRYTRWDLCFSRPPLAVTARGQFFDIQALNERGRVLLPFFHAALFDRPGLRLEQHGDDRLAGEIVRGPGGFAEEERSRQPSVFTVLRAVQDSFASPEDEHLGLYGAFGYDLVFQFEDIALHQARAEDQRDLVLYLPDRLYVVDHRLERTMQIDYDFATPDGGRTAGLGRTGEPAGQRPRTRHVSGSDHAPGQYAEQVRRAIREFACGNLFEVVPGQTLSEPCDVSPVTLFRRLKKRNPSPYGFLINLGHEHLIGASPEMYVRVEGRRVETCPISGTIARGRTPLEDAEHIRELLNSTKDESELTMCTDVDRNDKSRICEPGSVRVIGRRQIEMYSRVIHTVDHVEGTLRDDYDALDAFLTHMWAVTVTGAPKRAAIDFLERHELSPRRWYGGAVGVFAFDGHLNTGLTLRTIRLEDGIAQVRAGATLLFDSDPDEEERETRNKAAAMLDAILVPDESARRPAAPLAVGAGKRILLVDHQDSFVHTLANYFRQTGARVVTRRSGFSPAVFDDEKPDLVVLSPGPGTPDDFRLADTIRACLERDLPIFGVCLGLQGIVEYFGGKLGVLEYPMHGKPSMIVTRSGEELFAGMPERFQVGRYHSLYALRDRMPSVLDVTAETVDDRVVMAVRHRELPVSAVQFHPESILTMDGDHGLRMIQNAVRALCVGRRQAAGH